MARQGDGAALPATMARGPDLHGHDQHNHDNHDQHDQHDEEAAMTVDATAGTSGPVIDPTSTYVHFGEGPDVRRVPVTADFWPTIGSRRDLQRGRLLTSFPQEADWTSWERHPAGDELVYLVDGSATVHLDDGRQVTAHRLEARQAVLVPAGVWHTADVHEPGHVLVLTWGEGTEHRPR